MFYFLGNMQNEYFMGDGESGGRWRKVEEKKEKKLG